MVAKKKLSAPGGTEEVGKARFNVAPTYATVTYSIRITRDDHQNLKLLSIDLNQMHLIGLVERTILVFKSSKSDVSLQSYGL